MHDFVGAGAGSQMDLAETPASSEFAHYDLLPRTPRAGSFPPVADYPQEAQFRIAVVGNMIDKIAQDGDTLICIRADVAGAAPQDGDLVVVEDHEDADYQVTIRRLRRVGDLCEFRNESSDPAFQGPPLICDMRFNDGTVRLLGKVLFACRRFDA